MVYNLLYLFIDLCMFETIKKVIILESTIWYIPCIFFYCLNNCLSIHPFIIITSLENK